MKLIIHLFGKSHFNLYYLYTNTKEDKPILAICVYHKRDDYYHLLDIIKDI